MIPTAKLTFAPWSALALLAASMIAAVPGAVQAQGATPPQVDEAMSAICNQAARDSRCLLDGREMTYWIGFPATVDGRHWYTVVATAADHLAADEGSDDASPAPDKVRISQVTFEAVDGRWKQIARQIGFGSVFTNTSGNPAAMNEATGRSFVQAIPGAVIVGHPISQMANEGITLHGHAIFRSAPDKSGRWLYAGDILAGSDNGASGCDEQDAPQACYASKSSLALTGKSISSWPEIKVDLTGTVVAENGKVRSARPADAQLWRFDPAEAAYTTDTPDKA